MVNLLTYQSVRYIKVDNWKLGIVYYGLQGIIFMYILVYSIIVKKGYQEYDNLIGSISTKMKGTALSDDKASVFDANDLVIPPQEENALFLATTFIRTHQSRFSCDGNDPKKESCKSNDDCLTDRYTNNGYKTGICSATGFCQLQAWCPLENEKQAVTVENVENWKVFVKANVYFPNFGVERTNVDGKTVDGLNLFSVAYILEQSGYNYSQVANTGAVILISINYDCDLNRPVSQCQPQFRFSRIDDPSSNFSTGFNFRMAYKSTTGASFEETRELYKYLGIRIIFNLYGTAGKFNVIPLLLTLGAGVGLLSISTLVCDFILQYLLPNKDKYVVKKIEDVGEDEEPLEPRSSSRHDDL